MQFGSGCGITAARAGRRIYCRRSATTNICTACGECRRRKSCCRLSMQLRMLAARDVYKRQAQDVLAMIPLQLDRAKEKFELLLTQQYQDGHCNHYFFPTAGWEPVTRIHSDNHQMCIRDSNIWRPNFCVSTSRLFCARCSSCLLYTSRYGSHEVCDISDSAGDRFR